MKFEIQVPYEQVQSCLSAGSIVASIEADSADDALEIFRKYLSDGNNDMIDDGTAKINMFEDVLEPQDGEDIEYAWADITIDAEVEVEA